MKKFSITGEVQDVHAAGRGVHVTRDCLEQIESGFYLVKKSLLMNGKLMLSGKNQS
jgi:hypothetical protein